MATSRRSLFEDVERILGPLEEDVKANDGESCGNSLPPPKVTETAKKFNLPKLVVKLENLNVYKTEDRRLAGASSKANADELMDCTESAVTRSNRHIKKSSSKMHAEHEPHDTGSDSGSQVSTLSDFESDDDDLVGVAFLKKGVQDTKVAQKKLPKTSDNFYEDDSFVQPKYKFGLGSILSEREAQIQSNLQLQEMEQELKEDRIKVAAEPLSSTVLAANNLDVAQFLLPHTKIKDEPPGIDAVDPSKVFTLYRLPVLPTSPLSGSDNQVVDHIFSRLNPVQIPNFIKQRTLEQFPKDLSHRSWLMTYLFHLLAIHPSCDVVDACHRILFKVQAYYGYTGSFDAERSWRPTVEDVVAVFVNYGAKLDYILPKETLFSHMDLPFLKERFGSSDDTFSSSAANLTLQIPATNLPYFLKTLESYIRCGLYSDEELLTVLFALSAVALDTNLILLSLDSNFRECIDAALQSFSINYWENEIKELAVRLVDLGVHHHNFVYLGQLMICNERAQQFQKVFCFLALHRLLEVEVPTECSFVTPIDVYQFVRYQSLVSITDYYMLQSIFLLIDMCIGKDPIAKYKDNLEDFSSLLREMAGKIRDNVHCLDATRVKNLIVRICSKWTFTAQTMPSSQQKLFRYMPVTKVEHKFGQRLPSPQSDNTELADSEATELASLHDEEELPNDDDNDNN